MPAKIIPLGQPAHDAEREAITFLAAGLPDTWTVYSNPWLVDRSGAVYELDTVVVAPHAIYVVELKAYRGRIEGNDNDWWIPAPIRSPLKLNRTTAQILASTLRARSYECGRVWVEGFVFLSHTYDVDIDGPASRYRVYTRKDIHAALTDEQLLRKHLSRLRAPGRVDDHVEEVLHRLLVGADRAARPRRRIRSYLLEGVTERTEHFVEHLATNELTDVRGVLRVYPIPALATEEQRRRVEDRGRWEAQVLAKIGRHPNVLRADPPFIDDAGLCLPFEFFEGTSLTSWVAKHHAALRGKASLAARVTLWRKIADAIAHAHAQGVVHRLLRPDVVLVADAPLDLDHPDDAAAQPAVRVTGFDLAKQLHSPHTVAISTAARDERLQSAAPEVIDNFSAATAASDQFGLGALLGHLLAGRPLFDAAADYARRGALVTRVRDVTPYVPASLDAAVTRMLAIEPVRRFPTLADAVAAVDEALAPRRAAPPAARAASAPPFDPDDIPPGTHLGTDYQVQHRLGAGGLATVYAARHLVSDQPRALKVARPNPEAEESLQAEYRVLSTLDHTNIVRAIDISNLVPDRKTLILERVDGLSLGAWSADNPEPDANLLQRFARDLFAALIHLEERGLLHKDLKPDNLIVGDGHGLVVIDFSLVELPPARADVGTALYRDPTLTVWDHAADRYAAALCLFELYEARHPFGAVPAPDAAPDLDDLDVPALAPFWAKALHPNRHQRHPSAVAMRAAFGEALSVAAPTVPRAPDAAAALSADRDRPLAATPLGPATVAALGRVGVHTQGQLVDLDDAQLRAIRALGKKKRNTVVELRQALLDRGVPRAPARAAHARPLDERLVGDPSPASRLGLPPGVVHTLASAGFLTVGDLAGASPGDLHAVDGVAAGKVALITGALGRYLARRDEAAPARALEDLWRQALAPLAPLAAEVIDALCGRHEPPVAQAELAGRAGRTPAQITRAYHEALDTLDREALAPAWDLIEAVLDRAGGVERVDAALVELAAHLPAREETTPSALVRLLVRLHAADVLLHEVGAVEDAPPLLARPPFTAERLGAFSREVHRLAVEWPVDPETARESLRGFLPDYPLNHLALAERVVEHVELTGTTGEAPGGALFVPPIDARRAIPHVLAHLRLPLPIDAVRGEVEASFGQAVAWPEPAELHAILAERGEYVIRGDLIERGERGGGVVSWRADRDPLPPTLVAARRSPAQVVGDLLATAAETRGFRMLVTPPERHPEIGRSVARALGSDAHFVSFEEAFLARIDEDFSRFERAERFKAQRGRLFTEATALIDELVATHGRPGQRVVLGDTALLELCGAVGHVMNLYDRTMSGLHGFWVLVVPGVIHKRQPLFNERAPMFQIEGAVLPLGEPIPSA